MSRPTYLDDPAYVAGIVAGLESFRAELLENRVHVELETEPVFDVIVDLLDRVIAPLAAARRGGE